MSATPWQFHFRNCDVASGSQPGYESWFGVCHAYCDGDVYDGRGECWGVYLQPNPQGGDNSVYNPGYDVIDPDQILDDIVGGVKDLDYFLVYIASEGDDTEALSQGIQGALNLAGNVVNPTISGLTAAQLQNYLNEDLAVAAAAVNMTPAQIKHYANYMGLTPGAWGFISGADYFNRVCKDHQMMIDNKEEKKYGWTVIRTDPDDSGSNPYIPNGAWTQGGALYYMWDRWLLPNWGNTSTLWLPYPGGVEARGPSRRQRSNSASRPA